LDQPLLDRCDRAGAGMDRAGRQLMTELLTTCRADAGLLAAAHVALVSLWLVTTPLREADRAIPPDQLDAESWQRRQVYDLLEPEVALIRAQLDQAAAAQAQQTIADRLREALAD
jgi:hypothetical protein